MLLMQYIKIDFSYLSDTFIMLLAFHIVPWNSLFLGVHTKLGRYKLVGVWEYLCAMPFNGMKAFTGHETAWQCVNFDGNG